MQISKENYAFVQRYYEDAASPTGYTMRLLYVADDSVRTVPMSREYWDVLHTEEYVFPLVQENMILPQYDTDGVLVGGAKPEPGNGYFGAYRCGCPRGFGSILRVEGNRIIVDGKRFNELLGENLIAFYNTYRYGSFPPVPNEDLAFEMTDDVGIYCLDFFGGDRYQKRRSRWYLNDVLRNNKNCYWLNLFDVWNGEGKVDQIVMFRQPPKGPDATAGNLNEVKLTNAQRFEQASGSRYEDESWFAD